MNLSTLITGIVSFFLAFGITIIPHKQETMKTTLTIEFQDNVEFNRLPASTDEENTDEENIVVAEQEEQQEEHENVHVEQQDNTDISESDSVTLQVAPVIEENAEEESAEVEIVENADNNDQVTEDSSDMIIAEIPTEEAPVEVPVIELPTTEEMSAVNSDEGKPCEESPGEDSMYICSMYSDNDGNTHGSLIFTVGRDCSGNEELFAQHPYFKCEDGVIAWEPARLGGACPPDYAESINAHPDNVSCVDGTIVQNEASEPTEEEEDFIVTEVEETPVVEEATEENTEEESIEEVAEVPVVEENADDKPADKAVVVGTTNPCEEEHDKNNVQKVVESDVNKMFNEQSLAMILQSIQTSIENQNQMIALFQQSMQVNIRDSQVNLMSSRPAPAPVPTHYNRPMEHHQYYYDAMMTRPYAGETYHQRVMDEMRFRFDVYDTINQIRFDSFDTRMKTLENNINMFNLNQMRRPANSDLRNIMMPADQYRSLNAQELQDGNASTMVEGFHIGPAWDFRNNPYSLRDAGSFQRIN